MFYLCIVKMFRKIVVFIMKEKIRKIVFGLQNMLMMRKGVELNMNDEYCERFVWEACREEDCFDLYEPSDEYDA